MSEIDVFEKAYKSLPNKWMKEWIKQGNKILGYTCSYIPEELIDAINVMPIRLRPVGARDTGLADAYMSRLNCTYTRYMLDIALDDKLDFMEGAVCFNSCDHVRRMFDNFKWKVKLPFYHFLSVPHHADEDAIKWFKKELMNFKFHLENHLKKKIEASELARAIKEYNEFRTLTQQLNDLRKMDEPVVTGEEVMKANLMRGVEYQYLLANSPGVRSQFHDFVSSLELGDLESGFAGKLVEPGYVESDVTLIDPGTPQEIGFILAPPEHPEYHFRVIGGSLVRLKQRFNRLWFEGKDEA